MSSVSQASILIVDSDPETLFTIASLLIPQDYRVWTAKDGEAALEIARSEPLDLLITEESRPSFDNGELVESIRTLPEKDDLPVMFLSSAQAIDVVRRVDDSRGVFHLKKPVAPDVLIELVQGALWMPHLVHSHIEQKTVKPPHVSFARNPLVSPYSANSQFPGTPIAF